MNRQTIGCAALFMIALVSCIGPKVSLERPQDGIVSVQGMSLVDDGPAFERVEGYVAV